MSRITHKIIVDEKSKCVPGHRNTFGGSPIMSPGQTLPECGICGDPLALFFQFDLKREYQLPFECESHFLLFGCVSCEDETPRSIFLDKDGIRLDPSYGKYVNANACLLLNRSGREEVKRADNLIAPRQIKFDRVEEKSAFSNYAGQETSELWQAKMGGVPAWPHNGIKLSCVESNENSVDVRCTCGARFAFIGQFPSSFKFAGMKEASYTFFAQGFITIFGCVDQCSPSSVLLKSERQ